MDVAAADPVPGANLLYTVHFYAGTHAKPLRDKILAARARGAAVFVSEWGASSASGDGGPYLDAAGVWLRFLDEQGISWVNWSLCNKDETSAALEAWAPLVPDRVAPDGSPVWPVEQLSASGAYVRARIRGDP